MKFFETQYSTLSSHALNEHIQSKYGLKNTTCKYLLRGVSDTYQISGDACSYIFKLYRKSHRTLAEIEGEVELLNILKLKGANVAFPVQDLEGRQLQSFLAAEGTRYGVLFSYAQGKVIYNFSQEQLKIIGREMAFNHNLTSKIQLQNERKIYDLHSTLVAPLQELEPAFLDYAAGYGYLKETAGKVVEKMESMNTASFGYGYCHYDYLPKNFHFDENNQLTVFDFDFAGKGLLANDLMSFLVHYFFHVNIKGMPKEEADQHFKIFLQGYKEVRPISEEELAIIPYLGIGYWMFYLGFQYNHYEDWSNTFFNQQHLYKWIDWMKKWEELYCKF